MEGDHLALEFRGVFTEKTHGVGVRQTPITDLDRQAVCKSARRLAQERLDGSNGVFALVYLGRPDRDNDQEDADCPVNSWSPHIMSSIATASQAAHFRKEPT